MFGALSSKAPESPAARGNWSLPAAVLLVVVSFIGGQYVSGLIAGLYAHHWWQSLDAVATQFVYVLCSETLTLTMLWLFLRWRRNSFRLLGLGQPRARDPAYAVIGAVVYFLMLFA